MHFSFFINFFFPLQLLCCIPKRQFPIKTFPPFAIKTINPKWVDDLVFDERYNFEMHTTRFPLPLNSSHNFPVCEMQNSPKHPFLSFTSPFPEFFFNQTPPHYSGQFTLFAYYIQQGLVLPLLLYSSNCNADHLCCCCSWTAVVVVAVAGRWLWLTFLLSWWW